ncbi:MAG: metalloregulator ArsR/SmtB family transcription factor [Spirochaetota bacterium]|nr:metalloregulator ArsR/SmtB family transcription factor [Spirochaetota bacterium]
MAKRDTAQSKSSRTAQSEDTFLCDCDVIHEDVVRRVRSVMPDQKEFRDLANLYKMFSDTTRIKILWAISCEPMCVCDLAALLETTKSAVSHQLKSLRLAKLVKYERKGKAVYYSLEDENVQDIFEKGSTQLKDIFLHSIFSLVRVND